MNVVITQLLRSNRIKGDAMTRRAGLASVAAFSMALSLSTPAEAGIIDFIKNLCGLGQCAQEGSKLRIAYFEKLSDPKATDEEIANAKALADAATNKTLKKATDTLLSAPLTSKDLGKTPAGAAKSAIIGTAKDIIKNGINAAGQSSPLLPAEIDVATSDLEIIATKLWDEDPDTGEPLDMSYIAAHDLPIDFFDDPTQPLTVGVLDLFMEVTFSEPISVDVLNLAFGTTTDSALFTGFFQIFPEPGTGTSMPFFDDGLSATAWILWEFALPLGDEPIGGPVALTGQMFLTSNACCVPEPATFALVTVGLGALTLRRRLSRPDRRDATEAGHDDAL